MPFYLKDSNAVPHLAGLRSVLIVPCRFCPAASLSVRARKPYLEPLRRFLQTEAHESYVEDLERRLRDEGHDTAVFESRLPHQFVACMWTARRRRELARRAAGFDAAIVLGCDAMVDAVRGAIGGTGCRAIQGMEIEGLMNVLPSVSFPLSVSLQLQGVTPVGTGRPALTSSERGR